MRPQNPRKLPKKIFAPIGKTLVRTDKFLAEKTDTVYHIRAGNQLEDVTIERRECIDLPVPRKRATNWFDNGDFVGKRLPDRYTPTRSLMLFAKFTETGFVCTLNGDGQSYSLTKVLDKTITERKIPDSYQGKPVTAIGERAFMKFYSLKDVTIPDTVTEIGSSAFYNCIAITEIAVPNSVTKIGSFAFYGCTIGNIAIPDSVKVIEERAFAQRGD